MWPFRGSKQDEEEEEDEESVYTEEEYEEDVEYEIEVTDDEEEEEEDGILVESADYEPPDESIKVEVAQENNEENIVIAELVGSMSLIGQDEDDTETDDEHDVANNDQEEEDEEDDDKGEYSQAFEDTEGEDTEGEENEEEEEEEEEEAVTSMQEKLSLLKLAAEHDRVDILQSILSLTEETCTPEERHALLNDKEQPPLHIAVSFGSTNATTCLLRLGANPALRPNGDAKKIAGRTAWELAFGGALPEQSSSLSPSQNNGGGSAEKQTTNENSSWFSPQKGGGIIKPVDMAPSKREGIRHAFTAEALRSIGADDVARLQQLLESGMPADTDIGGDKDIAGWCREMDATQCLKLVVVVKEEDEPQQEEEPQQEDKKVDAPPVTPIKAENKNGGTEESPRTPNSQVRRLLCDMNDAESLHNRLEELDTLAASLSTYLDTLAEEVSVCHGLLLMGNGASALASHVRALRETQDFLRTDLNDRRNHWSGTEAELNLYMRRYMIKDDNTLAPVPPTRSTSFQRQLSTNDPVQLRAQLGASENKIRKLRASIADMSEESEAAMKEVEKRGLTGGIQLVRKLREQIRELEFQVSEAKNGAASARAKLQKLQQKEEQQKKQQALAKPPPQQSEAQQDESKQLSPIRESPSREAANVDAVNDSAALVAPTSLSADPPVASTDVLSSDSTPLVESNGQELPGGIPKNGHSHSEKVITGQSDAMMKYNGQSDGYVPLDLWQILLRIIGLGRVAVEQQVEELKKQSSTVMIV